MLLTENNTEDIGAKTDLLKYEVVSPGKQRSYDDFSEDLVQIWWDILRHRLGQCIEIWFFLYSELCLTQSILAKPVCLDIWDASR